MPPSTPLAGTARPDLALADNFTTVGVVIAKANGPVEGPLPQKGTGACKKADPARLHRGL